MERRSDAIAGDTGSKPAGRRLTQVGILLTIAWVAVNALFVWLTWDSTRTMSLNQWGDFLSGSVSAPALAWLIVGFFLQREELRLNTLALYAQRDEMKCQEQATQALVSQTSRQAKALDRLANESAQAYSRIGSLTSSLSRIRFR